MNYKSFSFLTSLSVDHVNPSTSAGSDFNLTEAMPNLLVT